MKTDEKMLKFSDLPMTDAPNRVLRVENAKITSVSLSNEDHGALTAWLFVEFGSGGCGFGGYKLDDELCEGIGSKNYTGYWITHCMRVGGVTKWEDLEDKPIRVLHEGLGGGIVAIGHFIDDVWFCPRVEFKQEQ